MLTGMECSYWPCTLQAEGPTGQEMPVPITEVTPADGEVVSDLSEVCVGYSFMGDTTIENPFDHKLHLIYDGKDVTRSSGDILVNMVTTPMGERCHRLTKPAKPGWHTASFIYNGLPWNRFVYSWRFKVDLETYDYHHILIDLEEQTPADIDMIERASQEVHQARYGKLDPTLFDILVESKAEDEFRVAVWLTAIDREQLISQLQNLHPDASIENTETPWRAIEDKDRGQKDYYELLEQAHLDRQKPLEQFLRSQGYKAKLDPGMPVLRVTLPKQLIMEIEKREDVGSLYLISDAPLVPLLE